MPDAMNPSLGDLEAEASGQKRSLQQTMPPEPINRFIGNVGGGLAQAAQPWIDMAKYPGQVFQRGMAGDIPTTEEMVPWAAQTAQATAGLGTPAALPGTLGSAGGRLFTPEGAAIKGREFSKRSGEVLRELEQQPKGTGPMDLSSSSGAPSTAQKDLERYAPPRGVSPRLQRALANPDVIAGVKQSIEEGKGMGAHQWYHTEPIRQAFAKAYAGSNSDPGGAKAFKQFMDLVAATSPRSDVPTNIRNASYYFGLARRGEEVPEQLPYPYGHVAQKLHRQNVGTLSAAEAGEPGWNVLRNPKPASFSENLQGNLKPVTVDTHAFRNIAMRTNDPEFLEPSTRQKLSRDPGELSLARKYGEISPDGTTVTFRPRKLFEEGRLSMEEAKQIPSFWVSQPSENEYGAAEEFYRKLAAEHGLAPADAQAAAWAGGGKLTGLGSPPAKTFAEMMNERVAYSAKMRGEDPQQTLLNAILGRVPLLSLGGLAAGAAAQQAQQPSLPATAEPTPRT